MLRRIQRSDRDVEKRIITGMIISDKVLTHLLPFSQPDVFELEVSKHIVRWITEYYDKYKAAPKKHIKDLYESEKGKLKQGLDEEIGLFLTKLSEEYLSEGGPDGVNEDFIIDKGREYLKIRHLRRVAEGINSLLDIGKPEEAEKFYESNSKIVDAVTYNWVKPLDDSNFINSVFEEKETPLFRMKGKLGDMIGDLYRGWLWAVMGPMKRGKCIAKGSLIPLSNGGLIPIENVKKGDIVVTLNENLQLEYKQVDEFYDNGIKPVFSITTRSGREVSVTDNHPFLTINEWKNITEMKEGDFIAVPKFKWGSAKSKKYMESSIIWDKIMKITSKGLTNTYDLTINGNHNFVANDIIVHNTWSLEDVAIDGVMSRKRVAYLSFEMKTQHQAVRVYKHVGVMGEEEAGSEYIFPCFDCLNNQDNSCNNTTRMNNEAAPSKFDPKAPGRYKPCTACRKIPGGGNFLATTWFFVADRPKLTLPNTRKEIKKFNKMFGKNLLRMISFPAYSATMTDVEDSLDELERVEGFIPDIIITDYASIIKPEKKYNDPRHDIGDIFKAHKRLAQTRSALVVTGAQSLGAGRSALSKDMQDESDIGETAYILAHVDILTTLDQTPEEKEKGIWRTGVIEHRWKRFNKRRQVMMLQQLELGQPIIDAETIFYSGGKKKED